MQVSNASPRPPTRTPILAYPHPVSVLSAWLEVIDSKRGAHVALAHAAVAAAKLEMLP